MANLKEFSTQEAVNAEAAGKWLVQTAIDTSALSTATDTTHVNVSDYHNVVIDCTSTIDILFDTAATTDCNDTNDLKLPQGVHALKIPKGLGNTIYLHWRRNGSVNATVRMVLT
jgi:hypothetical protein